MGTRTDSTLGRDASCGKGRGQERRNWAGGAAVTCSSNLPRSG